MGKPSRVSSRNSSTSSLASNKSSKMNTIINIHKLQKKIKKKQNKTRNNVKKLFERLRNESKASTSTEVIELDEVITPVKRKISDTSTTTPTISKKARISSDTAIDIHTIDLDNEPETPTKTAHLVCSTPILNKNNDSLDFIPISNIKKTRSKSRNNNTSQIQNFNTESNLTREINSGSYLTIDLTTESLINSSVNQNNTVIENQINTVIELDSTVENPECTVISVNNSNTSLSISGESDVTVLNMPKPKNDRQMKNFARGIAKLDASQKGKLLDYIAKNIFSGCNVQRKDRREEPAETSTRATETVEDTYIKEVILGQVPSRNSIGSNIYNPQKDKKNTGLRMIVIDGSNVAMQHTRGRTFSVEGLKICIDYFVKRGHVVKAFVPHFRCKYGKSSNPRLLDALERQGLVVYTPSREIQGLMIASYDDRYIVQCAAEFDGVIVSLDNYRDLMLENPRWHFVIQNRLLPFTWVHDMLMFPTDPLGRNGPKLEEFLRHPN